MKLWKIKSITLTLYIKGKDSIINRLTLVLEAYRERKNPVHYLRPHFINPKGLLDAIAKSNIYILGSHATDYFIPSSAKPYSNFNFYI